jgi:hypothetical protein
MTPDERRTASPAMRGEGRGTMTARTTRRQAGAVTRTAGLVPLQGPGHTAAVPFHDVKSRGKTRIAFIYGLRPRITAAPASQSIGDLYEFGRLAGHVQSGQNLLPRVIVNEQLVRGGAELQPGSLSSLPPMESLRVVVTVMPRGDPVLLIDGEVTDSLSPEEIAGLLAVTCFDRSQMHVAGVPLTKWLQARLAQNKIDADSLDFGSDVHQCVFPDASMQEQLHSRLEMSGSNRIISQILYRGTLPADSGSVLGICLPPGLNNPGSTYAAHGRGVSVFGGWAIYLENAFMLTAISTVSALGALRLARHEAFETMALTQDATLASDRNSRSLVSQLADRFNEMQLDLSFGVETHIDSILIPEMMVESFQRSLSEAVGIRDSLDNTSRMLQRVGTVISVRLSKLEAADRERIERRERLIAVLVAVASLLALPPALLLAFFGINARQVSTGESIFDFHAYWGAYVIAWIPFILLVCTGGFLYSRIRRRADSSVRGTRR